MSAAGRTSRAFAINAGAFAAGAWCRDRGSSEVARAHRRRDLIERDCRLARRFAEALQQGGCEILNEVVLNQVLVSFGGAERRRVKIYWSELRETAQRHFRITASPGFLSWIFDTCAMQQARPWPFVTAPVISLVTCKNEYLIAQFRCGLTGLKSKRSNLSKCPKI